MHTFSINYCYYIFILDRSGLEFVHVYSADASVIQENILLANHSFDNRSKQIYRFIFI